jgi:hypothetical protein
MNSVYKFSRSVDLRISVWLIILSLGIFFCSCSKDETKLVSKPFLQVFAYPEKGGTVSIDPAKAEFDYDSIAVLTAEPFLGYAFLNWDGDLKGSDNPKSIIMNGDKTITAYFIEGVNENFNDGIADYFIDDESDRWMVTNKAYKLTGAGAGDYAYSYYPYQFGNIEFSVDLKLVEGTNNSHYAGIFFRSKSTDFTQNSYRFLIMNNLWCFGQYSDGIYYSFSNNWVTSEDLNTEVGATNNLAIQCTGYYYEVFINGLSQGHWGYIGANDATPGYIGITGYDSPSVHYEYEFDNLQVYTLGSK